MKDSIDFGSMDISTLFRKLLVPTVIGNGILSYIRYYRRHIRR